MPLAEHYRDQPECPENEQYPVFHIQERVLSDNTHNGFQEYLVTAYVKGRLEHGEVDGKGFA